MKVTLALRLDERINSPVMKLPPFIIILLGLSCMPVFGQPAGSSARDILSEIQKNEPRVEVIIERANDHFRKGKLNLEDKHFADARDEFDKAIDVILMSGMDVRSSQRLRTFYLELVERIYREEVALLPPPAPPGIIKNPLTLKDLGVREAAPKKTDPQLFKLCNEELFTRASIRGLKLRMTLSEAQRIVPSLRPGKTDTVGASESTIWGPFKSQHLIGLRSLGFQFLDSKIVRITARYNNPDSWDTTDQFILHIAKTFGLPMVWDELVSSPSYLEKNSLKQLECRDSAIVAGVFVGGYSTKYPVVMLTDTAAQTDLERRTQKRIRWLSEQIERLRSEDRAKFKP